MSQLAETKKEVRAMFNAEQQNVVKFGKRHSSFHGDGWSHSCKHKLIGTDIIIFECWSSEDETGRNRADRHYFDIKIGKRMLMYADRIPMRIQANTQADDLPIKRQTYKLNDGQGGCLVRFFQFENALKAAKLYK